MKRRRGDVELDGGHLGWKGECGVYGFFCYDGEANIVDAARNLFLGVVVAWSLGIVSAHLAKKGRIQWKIYWTGSVCLMLCIIQTYYLYRAANVNISSYYFSEDVYRYDCYESRKGGKIAQDESIPLFDRNPCFCHEYAACRDAKTNAYIEPSSCPLDGSAYCREYTAPATRRSISPTLSSSYIDHKRDCSKGRRDTCTKEQPCTPCELDKLLTFPKASYCSMCSIHNNGDCNFKPGIGPYCLISPNSRQVQPCRRCCTEALPVYQTYTDPATNDTYTFCDMPKPSSS